MPSMTTVKTLNVLGICGSLRKASLNRALLRAAQEEQPEGMAITLCELHDIPLYNDDLYQPTPPEGVQKFRAAIAAADALILCAPEYNFSISGVVKNAIDWASRPPSPPLDGKPLALMGASMGLLGTVRGQLATRQVCIFTNMIPMNKPELFVGKAHEKFDSEGKLTDAETRQKLRAFLAAFSTWAQRVGSR
jgi:chromate reductase